MATHTRCAIIVDDEKELRETLSTILEVEGIRAIPAASGGEALQYLRSTIGSMTLPDLLITDISMPHMNGIEFVREVRSMNVNVPILVISGYGTKNAVVELMRLGVVDFIDKPFNAALIRERVLAALEHGPTADRPLDVLQDLHTRRTLHDFRNWLSAIMGYAELITLTNDTEPLAVQLEYARKIAHAIGKAASLSNDTLARISGQTEPNGVFEMDVLIAETLELQRSRIPIGIRTETDFYAQNHQVCCDGTKMRNAIANLIINAVQAMNGCGEISITTRNFRLDNKDCLVVRIADTGCGIDDKTRERIFEPGFSTKAGGGRGLGLSGVQEAVSDSCGTISVMSKPGQGTSFIIFLPLHIA